MPQDQSTPVRPTDPFGPGDGKWWGGDRRFTLSLGKVDLPHVWIDPIEIASDYFWDPIANFVREHQRKQRELRSAMRQIWGDDPAWERQMLEEYYGEGNYGDPGDSPWIE